MSLTVLAVVLLRGPEVIAGAAATPDTEIASAGSAEPVLAAAASQIGVTEARDRGTPFHDAYGIARREPWCAVWVWWVFQQAGDGDLVPKTAWTPALYQFFADRGRADRVPQVGSLVFYDWPGDGKDRISHVGIVIAVEPDAIVTIEGNTSSSPAGSQDDGDGVWERRRPLNGSIVGYGHPDYAAA